MSEKERKVLSSDLDIRLIENPEALGLSEKKLLRRIEPILNELLEELKANGKIETHFTRSELEHANSITENLHAIGTNNNLLIHTGDNNKARRFVVLFLSLALPTQVLLTCILS